MSAALKLPLTTHIVDILGSTKGRDQPIMLVDRALELVGCFDESLFVDADTVFFDPFCKAGEVLMAAALKSCLIKHGRKKQIASTGEITEELYSGRFFGLSPDERHYLLSKRTFYGNENSHNELFAKHIKKGSYLSEQDGRLNRGAFQEEFNGMLEFIKSQKPNSKIVAIGNPPYQESDGGFGKSARSVYNLFTEALIDSPSISEFVLVIPSRWFAGGKGLDGFRNRLITSKQVKKLRYFKNSSEVFPTVDINGGICFLHYSKSHDGDTNFSAANLENDIDLAKFDIIPDDPLAYSIVEKIKSHWSGGWVSDIAHSRKAFGLETDYFDKNTAVPESRANSLPCVSVGRIIKHIPRSAVTKNVPLIEKYKVCVPKAAGGSKGNRRSTVPPNLIFVIPAGTVCTETYNIVGAFDRLKTAEQFQSYLRTNFALYLVGLRKITQDIPKDRWDWVPLVNTTENWTDENLFAQFKLTKAEQEHLKAKVQEWS